MLATAPLWLHWIWVGLRESLSMLWITWWPLVLGFSVAGLVQSFIPHDGLRERLGKTDVQSTSVAAILGMISSSCSYAASSMSRAIFARGSSWTNALVFMVASTNLVIELGIVLWILLGWQFVVAQFVGGVVLIVLLALLSPLVFRPSQQQALRERVERDAPPRVQTRATSWRERVRDADNYAAAARYTTGDLTMVRKELFVGFLIAGFISAHVPPSFWSHLFISGHGTWTSIENAVLAPLVAVLAFVCSVGNIPLAAAMFGHGVAFGGVIAFIFADLITLPLLFIYRRFYGTKAMLRLLAMLWFIMSVSGLIINGLFHVWRLIPTHQHLRVLDSDFPLHSTLILNVLATVVLSAVLVLARRPTRAATVATDPVCGMTVDMSSPAATLVEGPTTYYFCSLRCRDRFDARHRHGEEMHEDAHGEHIDPVCSMRVGSDGLSAVGEDGVTYYFCSEGCRETFLQGPRPTASQPIQLGRKPANE